MALKKVKEGNGGTWATKYDKQTSKWDFAPNEKYFMELKRISINQIIWGANHFGYPFINFAIWRKLTISENFTMSMAEIASISINGNGKVFEYQPQDKNRFHPTQKPVALYLWLLKNYAKPGNKIFDSHMGSQSSRIAAEKMGLDYWGCEIDKEYFNAGCKRFESETMQMRLFKTNDKSKLLY
jgi:site-specific DNA-methyltransferase (adenine-specific)